MIKEYKRNGFLIIEQTTWYVYLNKKDRKDDKHQMMSSTKKEVWRATSKKIKKACKLIGDKR